jgi:aspartyl protease family protein
MKITFIILLILSFSITGESQSFSKPVVDTKSQQLFSLIKLNNFEAASALLSKFINANPNDGSNYFNRAVVNYLKKNKYSLYDIDIVKDCNTAKLCGYNTAELNYLLFLEFFYYNPNGIGRVWPSDEIRKMYKFCEQGIGFNEQKVFIDSAIKMSHFNQREKYIIARFKLFDFDEILTVFFETHKDELPTIKSDCESILTFNTTNDLRFLSYYYLSQVYVIYYTDTIKGLNYLNSAIDYRNINKISLKDKRYIWSEDLYAIRGKLKSAINNNDGAIEDYTVHLSKWNDPEIYRERAFCYLIKNDHYHALKDINKSISLYDANRKTSLTTSKDDLDLTFRNLDLGYAYAVRGLIYQDLNKIQEALNDYNKGIEYGSKVAVDAKNKLLELLTISSKEGSETNTVPMILKNGVYEIPVTVNETLNINFIFDAGAADVSISADVALTLIRTGTISDNDFIGTQTYQFADGTIAKSKIIILKELQIGNKVVTNVKATISKSLDAPLLLGQSALNRFGNISIDYKNMVIRFNN